MTTPSPTPRSGRAALRIVSLLLLIVHLGGMSAAPVLGSDEPLAGPLRIYTSVTQETVDAILDGFRAAHPDVDVEVLRAPTGELAGRIAAELRDGRILADVLWLTDPLSMQGYAEQGLLREWQPEAAADLPEAYRATSFWGTRVLNVVIVRGESVVPGPTSWADLADPAYAGAVAIMDPGLAGSAFGALAWFLEQPDLGIAWFEALRDNGAVQVGTPGDVLSGVAEGRFAAGMTLAWTARTAAEKGSPVELVWPTDGAIAVDSPVGVIETSEALPAAEAFVEFVLGEDGQVLIGESGWQTVRSDAGGPQPGGPQVQPDWQEAYGRQAELLEQYRAIFGG